MSGTEFKSSYISSDGFRIFIENSPPQERKAAIVTYSNLCRPSPEINNNRTVERKQVEKIKKDAKYTCPNCGKKFVSAIIYRIHVNLHNSYSTFRCRYCPRGFTTAMMRSQHELLKHKTNYTCNVCKLVFSSLNKLNTHQLTHRVLPIDDNDEEVDEVFICPVCKKQSASTERHERHIQRNHTENAVLQSTENTINKFCCPFCVTMFYIRRKYERHLKVHIDHNVAARQKFHRIKPE